MYNPIENQDLREIRRGEIYYIDLSNIDYADSHVIGKTRPGLIIQNNIGNENSPNVIVALFTGANKKPYPFQYKTVVNGERQTIMFDQIMTLSKQNIKNKFGELTNQQLYEADLALMCSLDLLNHSISSFKDFEIVSIISERTKDKEAAYCNIEITNTINDRENKFCGSIVFEDLQIFDDSIQKDTEFDEIKTKLNNCAGLNFIANHIKL